MIYTEYVVCFEIAAVILLVAIIAAIALTMRKRKDSKYLDPHRARCYVKSAQTGVRMVKIASRGRKE